jgi:hypothetical protein
MFYWPHELELLADTVSSTALVHSPNAQYSLLHATPRGVSWPPLK